MENNYRLNLSDRSKCLSKITMRDPRQFSFGVGNSSHIRDKVQKEIKRKAIKWKTFGHSEETERYH